MASDKNPNSFDREQLFEEVWAVPMKDVGNKHGISGTDVRRICDTLQIPLPPRGHWTLIAQGRDAARPTLPPMTASNARPAATTAEAEVGRSKSERTRARGVLPGTAPAFEHQKWHRALAGLRQKIEKDAARAERLSRAHDWEQSHPGKHYPPDTDAVYATWQYFCDAGQLLLTATHRKLVARLSIGTYKRGLSLLNAICHRAELMGYAVDMAEHEERLRLSKTGAHVNLRVTEKLLKGNRQTNSRNKSPVGVRTLTPTGRLALIIEQQDKKQTELSDRADLLLEQQLEDILATIACQHQGSARKVAEWKQREQQAKAAEANRKEQERQRTEKMSAVAKEDGRRRALLSEVENWRRAELIRAYVTWLDSRALGNEQCAPDNGTWQEWALAVANDLDPTCRQLGCSPRWQD